MKNKLLITLLLSIFMSVSVIAETYYIDAKSGKDSNSGTSPGKAWATLKKVNSMTFKPGDKILFKAGTSYNGQLEPQGSGSKNNPILIDRYGEGKKPTIHGKGWKLHTLLLYNIEYWEVRNLEITNTGETPKEKRRGVIVQAENFGDCNHIVLDSLEVHHVNGSLIKKDGGGSAILFQTSGKKVKTRFVDLIIQNNHLHHCERNGINAKGYYFRDNWHPSVGVIIRHNLIEQIPGDGIVPLGCDGALIEYNVLRDFPDVMPHSEAAAGIWPWSCDNTLIQYNEVSGHKAKWDGQGYDSDYNCRGTIFQYNYSHDNYGGFLLVCNNGERHNTPGNIGNSGTIVRHNISINDGIRPYPTTRRGVFSPTFHITGPLNNTQIYNNIIIRPANTDATLDTTLVKMDNWGGPWPEDTIFKNNIFVSDGHTSQFIYGEDKNTQFENNVYYGTFKNLPKDVNAVFSNPEFINDKARGDGFDILRNFMLNKDSYLSKKGIGVSENIFGK